MRNWYLKKSNHIDKFTTKFRFPFKLQFFTRIFFILPQKGLKMTWSGSGEIQHKFEQLILIIAQISSTYHYLLTFAGNTKVKCNSTTCEKFRLNFHAYSSGKSRCVGNKASHCWSPVIADEQ